MSKLKPLDLDNEVKIPDNELARSCFKMILRALISDEKEFDTKEEALDCIFSLLSEFKDEIKQRIKSACEFYLRYKDNPELLIEEHPEYEEELMSQFLFKYRNTLDRLTEIQTFYKWKYQEWLFKQVFKEVLKNEKD